MSGTNEPLRSTTLYRRALETLVGGVNSPVRAHRAVGGNPIFVERMVGAFVYDVDEREYVDLVGSWGTAIVGHAHPRVIEAVRTAATKGLSFGACCVAEADLAEVICGALPSVELLRFVSSGTEAVMSALRLARAVTARSKVVKFAGCYHGHSDGLLVEAGSGAATTGVPSSAGVPPSYASETLVAPFNDLERTAALVGRHAGNVAAVIVEPLAGNMGFVEPVDGFLDGLRELCDSQGCLLIFDEVMTGFRVGWGGYQVRCGVTPDVTCLGKVIGGGLPVAAYGGRRELMEEVSPLGPVYQAGTLSGNPVAMAAGLATLELCREDGFYDRLHTRAGKLVSGLSEAGGVVGIPVQTAACGGMLGLALLDRPVRNFEDARAANHELFARLYHAMLKRGVWLPPSGFEAMFISAAHDETVIDRVIDAARAAFREIAA